jgi:hypothetical protein
MSAAAGGDGGSGSSKLDMFTRKFKDTMVELINADLSQPINDPHGHSPMHLTPRQQQQSRSSTPTTPGQQQPQQQRQQPSPQPSPSQQQQQPGDSSTSSSALAVSSTPSGAAGSSLEKDIISPQEQPGG